MKRLILTALLWAVALPTIAQVPVDSEKEKLWSPPRDTKYGVAWLDSVMELPPSLGSVRLADELVKTQIERAALIRGLMRIVQDAPPESVGYGRPGMAVALLGELRAAEAAPMLVRKIRAEGIPSLFMTIGSRGLGEHPVADALMKIGAPALEELLPELVDSPDSVGVALCARVLGASLGEDLSLQILRSKLNEPGWGKDQRTNIEKAIAFWRRPEEGRE